MKQKIDELNGSDWMVALGNGAIAPTWRIVVERMEGRLIGLGSRVLQATV
jgi:hypothetical protein